MLRKDVVRGLYTSRASDVTREVTGHTKRRINESGSCDAFAGRCLKVVQGLREAKVGITTVSRLRLEKTSICKVQWRILFQTGNLSDGRIIKLHNRNDHR